MNALAEIRACRGELQTFLTAAFDRLDDMVGKLRSGQTGQEQAKPHDERGTLQNQIDLLARMAADLAHSVAEREQLATGQNRTASQEAKT